jgi:hypothetical protein
MLQLDPDRVRCVSRRPRARARVLVPKVLDPSGSSNARRSPQRGFIPLEAFHSSIAVPHHCGRFPLAVVVPHFDLIVPKYNIDRSGS